MDLVIGAVLAISVSAAASFIGFDRDRAFYPTVTVVIASYYALFAVMGGSSSALIIESLAGALFLALAVAGFRSTLWLVVLGLAAHAVFDLFHGHLISNPGVPPWWPGFCSAYDVVAAAYLGWLLARRKLHARAL